MNPMANCQPSRSTTPKGKFVDFAGGMLTQEQLQHTSETNYGVDVIADAASELAVPVILLIPRGT